MLKSIRILAFCEVDNETFEAWYRHICRWYSREFHTPLDKVLEMSEEYILQTYYEDIFYKLKSSTTGDNQEAQTQYNEIKSSLIKESRPTDDSKTLSEIAEEEDDEWYQEELARIQQETDAKSNKKDSKFKKIADKSQKPNLKDEPQTLFFDGEDPEDY